MQKGRAGAAAVEATCEAQLPTGVSVISATDGVQLIVGAEHDFYLLETS